MAKELKYAKSDYDHLPFDQRRKLQGAWAKFENKRKKKLAKKQAVKDAKSKARNPVARAMPRSKPIDQELTDFIRRELKK